MKLYLQQKPPVPLPRRKINHQGYSVDEEWLRSDSSSPQSPTESPQVHATQIYAQMQQ